MQRLRVLLVFGTRPEAIKMAPIVSECQRREDQIDFVVCLTGQHREMLHQVTEYFEIKEDEQLNLMVANQSLTDITARCLTGIDDVLTRRNPHCVVAQGDTTTAMAAAIVSFYRRIPFVHVEAGLRTNNLHAPFPEEMNRRIADLVADLYCAPTQRAADTLINEGHSLSSVQVTGNTVIDALLQTVERQEGNDRIWREKYAFLDDSRMVLITGHRRENFGKGFENICRAIKILSHRFPDCQFVYPVHLNPKVQEPVYRHLHELKNVHLISPVNYPEFVWLMNRSELILTDSGGIQEEAPSLGKPVLVMRDTTERPEAVEVGAARLVGTEIGSIVEGVEILLSDAEEYASCQISSSPYGDGHAADRIVNWMLEQSWN